MYIRFLIYENMFYVLPYINTIMWKMYGDKNVLDR